MSRRKAISKRKIYNKTITLSVFGEPCIINYELPDMIRQQGLLFNPPCSTSEVSEHLLFNNSGTLFIASRNSSIMVYNTTSTKINQWASINPPSQMPTSNIIGMAINPSNTILAIITANSPYMLLYNITNTTPANWSVIPNPSVLPTYPLLSVCFSPDGTKLVLGGYSTKDAMIIYNTNDWSQLPKPTGATGFTYQDLKFTPDGSKLITSIYGEPYLRIFNTTNNNPANWSVIPNPSILPTGFVRSIDISPDGTLFAVVSDSIPTVRVYNVSDNSVYYQPDIIETPYGGAVVYKVKFSPDGTILAVGANSMSPRIFMYDLKQKTKLKNPTSVPLSLVRNVVFQPSL